MIPPTFRVHNDIMSLIGLLWTIRFEVRGPPAWTPLRMDTLDLLIGVTQD